MELWDVYDSDRNKTGKTHIRGVPLSDGEYHLTAHICVFAPSGEMLIQRRSPDKKSFPGKWDLSAAGSVLSGESTRAAAERELFEELSLRISLPLSPPALSVGFKHGFDDMYVYTLSEKPDLNLLSLQKEEVCDVKWATEQEIYDLLKSNDFVSYRPSLISLLFEKTTGRYTK